MNTASPHPEPTVEHSNAVPLCLHCLEPVDPLEHTCPHCGGAVGQFTPYLPFESIQWSSEIWGRMWAQAWDKQTPIPGRIFRFLAIVWFVPILLLALFLTLLTRAWQGLRSKPA